MVLEWNKALKTIYSEELKTVKWENSFEAKQENNGLGVGRGKCPSFLQSGSYG